MAILQVRYWLLTCASHYPILKQSERSDRVSLNWVLETEILQENDLQDIFDVFLSLFLLPTSTHFVPTVASVPSFINEAAENHYFYTEQDVQMFRVREQASKYSSDTPELQKLNGDERVGLEPTSPPAHSEMRARRTEGVWDRVWGQLGSGFSFNLLPCNG